MASTFLSACGRGAFGDISARLRIGVTFHAHACRDTVREHPFDLALAFRYFADNLARGGRHSLVRGNFQELSDPQAATVGVVLGLAVGLVVAAINRKRWRRAFYTTGPAITGSPEA